MKCGCLSDAVRFSVGWSTHVDLGVANNSVRILVNLKLLLNRKELERVFYMKKLRLIDPFPTAYRLNHSEQRFVKISRKQQLPLVVRHTIFKINLKP